MTQMVWQAVHHPHAGDQPSQEGQRIQVPNEPALISPNPDLNRLLAIIQTHEIAEIDAVNAYREIARETTDPVMGSLMRMLLEDEEHHHRVLRAIALNLRAAAGGAREMNLPAQGVRAADIEPLREFARKERDGSAELRALAREAPDLFGGLFSLLLELIALDGEKHRLILQFVVGELEAARTLEREDVA